MTATLEIQTSISKSTVAGSVRLGGGHGTFSLQKVGKGGQKVGIYLIISVSHQSDEDGPKWERGLLEAPFCVT
jgi:hypothetical protein